MLKYSCHALFIALFCSGCQSMTALNAAAPATDKVTCAAFKPIYWSGKDTPATAAEVKEHNAAWTALCSTAVKTAKPTQAKTPTFAQRWLSVLK
jgi:invasion protein IalB